MAYKRTKKLKNRYSKSAKYSEYKTLQLIECFALDFPVRQTAKVTRMTERTVRDRFAEIRAKLLSTCLERPDLFNGFGYLLIDAAGNINLHILEVLFYYSESQAFKNRMAERYPKFRSEKDPALNHVMEMAVRRFVSIELPEANEDFRAIVKRIFSATQSEEYFKQVGQYIPAYKARQNYWKTAFKRLRQQKDFSVRRFPSCPEVGFYRDLKTMLRYDPL